MESQRYSTIDNLTINIKEVEKLKINKTSGQNGLPTYILRETATELAPIMTAIVKQSLKTGLLPEYWLKENIAPIFTKGKQLVRKLQASIYHAVVYAAKSYEHITFKHILGHLEKHNILTIL